MHSLVQDEETGDMRVRNAEELERDCSELFDARNRRNERDLFRERGKPKCPDGFISLCNGWSCGRPPRKESDLKDYSCISPADLRGMIRYVY